MTQVTPGLWPSGSWTVATLRRSPSEMSNSFGVSFESGTDDFDQYEIAAFRGWSEESFWLFRYENSPLPGPDVVVDSRTSRSLALTLIWDEWGFDIRELAWVTEWETFPGAGMASQAALLRRSIVPEPSLSGREAQVAEAYAAGSVVSDIAKQLRLAPSTVSGHLQRIYLKLGVHSRAELQEMLRRYPQLARSA